MALNKGYRVPNTVKTTDSRDKYPVADENDILGGSHIYATVAEMLAIPSQRRRVGMHCSVVDLTAGSIRYYRLIHEVAGNNTALSDWEELVELTLTEYRNIITSKSLNTILANYAKTTDLPDMSLYSTTNTIKKLYETKTDLAKDYYNKTDADNKFALKNDFDDLKDKVDRIIVAIKRPDLIYVNYNTAIADVPLPTQVEATYADGTVKNIDVVWNTATYVPTSEGMQIINGDLSLPANTLNTSVNVTQHIQVYPEIHVIAHFYTAMPITISKPYGTVFDDLELPEKVKVVYTDGTIGSIPVTWNPSQYSATDTNSQMLTGILELPDKIQYGTAGTINPTAIVLTRVKPQDIDSINTIDSITTFIGTPFNSLTLPDTISVTLLDGTVEDLEVEWDPSGYNQNNTGEQYVFGTLKETDAITNGKELIPVLQITVQTYPNIYDVEDLPIITIGDGTKLSNIALPDIVTIKTVAYDGSLGIDTANVVWDTSTIPSTLSDAGIYTITGTIPVPPPPVTNKINVIVYQDIQVVSGTITYVVSSVEPISGVSVDYNTDIADINLPTTADVNVSGSDGSTRVEIVPVTWNTTPYIKTIPGTYVLNGALIGPDGVVNTGSLTAKYAITVNPEPVTKTSNLDSVVVTPNYQKVAQGCSVNDITNLPTSVNIYIEETDGTISGPTATSVNWNTSTFRNNSIGKQIITGTIDLPLGVTNTKNLTAQFTVEIEATAASTPITNPVIVKVDNPVDISVAYDTKAEDLVLPTDVNVTIQLVNKTTITQSIPVVWNTATYDPETSGSQIISGGLTIDDPEIENPLGLQPQIQVVVATKPADPVISTYVSPTAISVPYGTPINDITLPTSVEATTIESDGSSKTITVPITSWNTSSYASNIVDNYTFIGEFGTIDGYDTSTLPDPQITITVAAKEVTTTTYAFETPIILNQGDQTIQVSDLENVTENDFYGYDTEDELNSRTFEVLYAGVVDSEGNDATILPNPVRVPIETSDAADVQRFVDAINAFDTANGTNLINDIPGGENCSVSYDESTHTITFDAISMTSNNKFIIRQTSDGSYIK